MYYYVVVLEGGKSKLSQEFTPDLNRKCEEVSAIILDVFERLEQAEITLWELELLEAHKEETMELFSIVVLKGSSVNVQEIISQRNIEVQKFESHFSSVQLLLQHCESIAEGTSVFFHSKIGVY